MYRNIMLVRHVIVWERGLSTHRSLPFDHSRETIHTSAMDPLSAKRTFRHLLENASRSAAAQSYCVLCGGPSEHAWCQACHQDLLTLAPRCPRCASPLAGSDPCVACLQTPPGWDCCRFLYPYHSPAKTLLHLYKYSGHAELAHSFAHYFCEELSPDAKSRALPQALLAVPLHWSRQLRRGFNQSAHLVQRLARKLDLPCLNDTLRRTLPTPSQVGMDLDARQRNLRHAFLLHSEPRCQHVAVVDDVLTTGATANAVARLLKQTGVRRIDLWTLARADDHPTHARLCVKHPGSPSPPSHCPR